MKVASKLIVLFKDPEGFGTSIYNALQPNPNSSLSKSVTNFELSLLEYGIKDQKACAHLANFVDNNGFIQVSLLLVEHYEPPVLPCALHEILRSITREYQSSDVILTLPYILSAAKLKSDDKNSSLNNEGSSLYGLQMGPTMAFTKEIIRTVEQAPSSLKIHYEPLACLLQFVHCLKFPTAVLIGIIGVKGEQEVLLKLGEHLANAFSLSFDRIQIKLNTRTTTKTEEPWRALYG
ncbi:uncharacterized protein LOC141611866 [Silene latifolia]|uniref:uncharacterized protein LOC141611866 n=1 Tax=Silene latifolia TaxID=37657 RepID=UPI003D788DAA